MTTERNHSEAARSGDQFSTSPPTQVSGNNGQPPDSAAGGSAAPLRSLPPEAAPAPSSVPTRRLSSPNDSAPEEAQSEITPLPSRVLPPSTPAVFPRRAITGSLGELARVLSDGTEVPEEFVFASALACFGAIASGKLKLAARIGSDTRLYVVLLGKSYSAKKSSAMSQTIEFFRTVVPETPGSWKVVYGVGSGEGLAGVFQGQTGQQNRPPQPNVLLAFDELAAFMEKTKATGSVLLEMAASLFESNSWDNPVRTGNVSVRNARLSMIGCCTDETYERVWTPEALNIGLTNRLFVVTAEERPKVAWPPLPPREALERLRLRIQQQLTRTQTFEIAEEARELWGRWYDNLPSSVHAKRLDTIGARLLVIYAAMMDKAEVDAEVVGLVTEVLDYELKVRVLNDPLDTDNAAARMEESIRRALKAGGPMTRRQLQAKTKARRAGTWLFKTALENLFNNGELKIDSPLKGRKGKGRKSPLISLNEDEEE